jgi:histidine kinase
VKPETLPLGAREKSRGEVPRFLKVALQAWRGITWRQWVWTTAIALLLLLAYLVGLLPPMLNAVPNLIGPQRPGWSTANFVGATLVFLAAAYCFLLAVSIAEHGAWHRLPPLRRYAAAGLAACGAAILMEMALYALVPSFVPRALGATRVLDMQQLLGRVMWSAANFGLTGGLALAVYVRFRSARFAREAFNAAEMERVSASREVLASRLAAMQARVEPGFLLGTLAQVEALYERYPQAGDRMLDGLIAYLHAALPQLRSQRSTLKAEMQLAESYLRIMQIRMGSRLDFQINVRPELGERDFPPMMLLPLIEDALRNGLEPLPHGGTIAITADAESDRVRVRVADDGLPRSAAANDGFALATLQERLRGLYGTAAQIELTADSPQGVIATIEVPLETARNHR